MSSFKAKMHQIQFRLGSAPDPAGGAYSAAPDPLAGGLLLREGAGKGEGTPTFEYLPRRGKRRGSGREGIGGDRERKRKGGKGRGEGKRGGEGGGGRGKRRGGEGRKEEGTPTFEYLPRPTQDTRHVQKV